MKKLTTSVILLGLLHTFNANSQPPKQTSFNQPPALSAIKEADLKRDMYAMAADHFADVLPAQLMK
ncbi:MAG TPA: hypothetical protein VF622_12270 [Segetibacter sp.]|jgi:hypothetical protein